MPLDRLGRPLRDLRISVTDRCNFRCTYCMPREIFGRDFEFLRREDLLTFEEITRLTQLFAHLGVEKIRLTGGEPLLRRDLESLVEMLAHVKGIRDLTITTNGSLLTREKARALKDAGLHRISISLDSLDDDVFRAMNDVNFPVQRVLDAIDAANEAGLWPIKIDMVVKRGVNEDSIVEMARRFRGTDHIVRFIEYMGYPDARSWSASRANGRSSRSARITSARSRNAGDIPMAAANSASSHRSRSRSAAVARARASLPTASCISACLQRKDTTCGGRCGTARRMKKS